MGDFQAIERFELIDHTHGAVSCYPTRPRMVIAKNINVELSLQDGGRTLKIFLSRETRDDTPNPACRACTDDYGPCTCTRPCSSIVCTF